MQSKTSFFNLALFKKNISRTWMAGLLYFILLLFIMPISFMISMAHFDDYYYAEQGYTKTASLYETLSYTPAAVWAFLMAIILAAITFWYLFFKRDNYMMHAFPVSRKSLFFTGFLSCSVVGVVPILLNGIIMTIVGLVEQAYAFDAIWYWTLISVISMELFLSIAVFSLMTSGQIVTAIAFYFIFNYLYVMIELAFRMVASLLLFGLGENLSSMRFNMFSPILFIGNNCKISTYSTYDEYGFLKTFTYTLDGAKYLLIYLIAAAVITFLAYMLYKYKKLETVQDFIAVPFLKPVFTVGMSFFISMVAGAFIAELFDAASDLTYSSRFAIAIVSTIIVGCIIFYVTQMMIEKTLRVFSARKFAFLLGYSACALVVMLLIRFDAFNIENKVPKADEVAWVGIQSTYIMTFTDEDEIASVRELHQKFLEDKKELRDLSKLYPEVSGSTITFKYKLKNDKVIYRTYYVVDTESDEVSATYVAAADPIVDYLNNPSRIKQHIIGNIWNDCNVKDMSFSTYTYDDNIQDFRVNFETFDDLTTKEKEAKFGRVYEAVLKDIDAGKLFITTFGETTYSYYYEDVSGTTGLEPLFNDFNFTVYNNNVPYFSDENTYWDYSWGDDSPIYQRDIYAQLNKDCTNTLKALFDEGFYTDEDQIITYGEYNSIMDNYY